MFVEQEYLKSIQQSNCASDGSAKSGSNANGTMGGNMRNSRRGNKLRKVSKLSRLALLEKKGGNQKNDLNDGVDTAMDGVRLCGSKRKDIAQDEENVRSSNGYGSSRKMIHR